MASAAQKGAGRDYEAGAIVPAGAQAGTKRTPGEAAAQTTARRASGPRGSACRDAKEAAAEATKTREVKAATPAEFKVRVCSRKHCTFEILKI